MKSLRLLFVLLIGLNSFNVFSQINQLDKKNGFKDFTLGDSYSKWSNNLKLINTDNGISYYKYTGSCCNEVFNYKLSEVRLGFSNDKLDVIYLITENQIKSKEQWISLQYYSIKNNLSSLFGTSSKDMPSETRGNVICEWYGDKTFLTLEYQYMGVKGNSDYAWSEDRCAIMIAVKPKLSTGF